MTARRFALAAARLWMLALPLAGCGDASGTVSGGEPILLKPAAAMPEGGNGNPLPVECQPGGANAGNGWADLFHCYFGPTGMASCSGAVDGSSFCHGAPSQDGTFASGGFQCPADVNACYTSITTSMLNGGPIVPVGATDATTTTLYGVLRQANMMCPKATGSCMPYSPTSVVFQPSDLSRITDWIQKGAMNN
jgi:hypothetical protein